MDHLGRVRRLQEQLSRHRLDSLLVTHLPNVRYLCGFTGSAGYLIVSERGAVFFTDGRYTSQAREEVSGARVVIGGKAPLLSAAEWLGKQRATTQAKKPQVLGIEGEVLSVAARKRLLEALPTGFRLRAAPQLVEQARMLKDAEEIQRIRAAVTLSASLFPTALQTIRPGVTENEVAATMEYTARKAGASGMSFPTIIASGARSALAHGRASEQPIPGEGFVLCDFGVILAGYCSDMTRTVYVGRATEDARALYEAVREAQQAAVEAVRPGISAGEVDQAARKPLKKRSLAKFFTHSTGHGVGLEIHEAPRVATGQPEVLRPGMVITIEPGLYIAGKWGVRIEDMVLVTEHGCDVLTPTSKQFTAI
jgi:Xaa-Pro aminopeptidase